MIWEKDYLVIIKNKEKYAIINIDSRGYFILMMEYALFFVGRNYEGIKINYYIFNSISYYNNLNYYFNELRYNKVNVYIYDYNTPSIKFHEKLGFKKEGRLRQMAYSMGKYHDTLFYGLLKIWIERYKIGYKRRIWWKS